MEEARVPPVLIIEDIADFIGEQVDLNIFIRTFVPDY